MDEVFLHVVEGILGKVISHAGDEIRLAWGFKAELERLSKRLKTAQSLLIDAENRKLVRMEAVQSWLKRLEAVAFEADDLVNEFAYEGLRRKIEVENRIRNKVRNFFSLSNPVAFRLKMAHRTRNINSSFDEVCKEATNVLALKPLELISNTPPVEPIAREIRLTHPFADDSQIEGREEDVSILVAKLLGSEINDDHQHLPAIAVVGMAGLGKTTVAQLVYKDEKVVRTFGEQRIWICVSDNFEVERLLNEMLHSLGGIKSETFNVQEAVRKLQGKLQGKKFLLVLDDVWNKKNEIWERFKNALLGINGDGGSKILVTTRSEEVVETMQAPFAHHLKGLSEDDCWKVFE